MLKNIVLYAFLILSMLHCKPQEDILTTESVSLIFKNDSNKIAKEIVFDTVLAGKLGVFSKPSISKRLKVINSNSKAIKTNITLLRTQNSSYSFYINGIKTTQIKDFVLRGNDSMYVLLQVTPDISNTALPFLVNDSLQFITNATTQYVKLTTWGRNAKYYKNTIITSNTFWDSTNVRFLYNTVKVALGASLTIQKGTKIYATKDSYLDVEGSLQVLGDTASHDKVQFQGERTEKEWDNVAGQWGGIILRESSNYNAIHNAIIKNAITGISVGNEQNISTFVDLKITHTILKNMSNRGIMAWHAKVEGWNNLAHNCLNELLRIENGGIYQLYSNTWANNAIVFKRDTPAIYISDGKNNVNGQSIEIDFKNNIFWGDRQVEFVTQKVAASNWNITLQNNIFKTDDTELAVNGNITSTNMEAIQFKKVEKNEKNVHLMDFGIQSASIAKGKGIFIPFITQDLANKPRFSVFDIGAYRF